METNKLLKILEMQVLGNSLGRYLFSLGLFIFAILIIKILESVVLRRLKELTKNSPNRIETFAIQTTDSQLLPVFYFAAFYIAMTQLVFTPELTNFIHGCAIVILTFQVTKLALGVTFFLIEEIWLKKHQQPESIAAFKSILSVIRFGVWGMALVFVLDNLGFNVAAVVAGLGIGGVAVALAAQTILGDLFNYFVIFFDRPFAIGDFIITGDVMGTVERVGIKTTRIRSLGGEQIILSNSSLTSSQVRNYKRMAERRVVFKIGVKYETPEAKLKEIPGTIRKLIENTNQTRFDRSHFMAFGNYSLDFETVYYINSPDYNLYMDIQQKLYFEIKEAFDRENIEFAYPTQVVYQQELHPKSR